MASVVRFSPTVAARGGICRPREGDLSSVGGPGRGRTEACRGALGAAFQAAPARTKRRAHCCAASAATEEGAGAWAGSLAGLVCLVTGGSRGVGRGIAEGLGEAGATVYVTGRTTEEPEKPGDGGGGTVVGTAERVTSRGGRGIAIACDHTDDSQVQAVMDRIMSDEGRLDILVNNCFYLPEGTPLMGKFWEQGAPMWDAVCNVGLRSHYVASCMGVPLLQRSTRAGGGLIVNVSSFGGNSYTFNTAYGVGKAGVDRLAADMAVELKEERIASISLWPGVVKTDRVLNFVAQSEGGSPFPMQAAETPLLAGRAVASLGRDRAVLEERTGKVQIVAELAQQYGFSEDDGSVPPSIRSLRFIIPFVMNKSLPPPLWLIPDVKLPLWVLAAGKGSATAGK